jgi:Ca-activated chloride channel family protein
MPVSAAKAKIACGFLALTIGFSPAGLRAADIADTVLILDVSGSMWGLVGGQSKISAARSAARTFVKSFPPAGRLGLMAYGHRRKADCADIELIAPVATLNPSVITSAIDALIPRGRTPIAESLKQAGQVLQSAKGKSTIILVSDGIETCGGDPCAVAAALKKSGAGLVAHVVGFDLNDNARRQLQCIASNTGGAYFDARDAEGLGKALQQATETAKGAPPPPISRPPAEPSNTNLRATVRLAENSDPIVALQPSADFGWRWAKADADNSVYQQVSDPVVNAKVEPGEIRVAVDFGKASAEVTVVISPGKPATVDLILNAGTIISEAKQAGSAGAAPHQWGQLFWQVFRKDEPDTAFTYALEAVPRFILPAGEYVLKVTKDDFATSQMPFRLEAGDERNLDLRLIAGTLAYRAPGANYVTVDAIDPKDGTTTTLGVLTSDSGEKALSPGRYRIIAEYSGNRVSQGEVAIAEGETTHLALSPR